MSQDDNKLIAMLSEHGLRNTEFRRQVLTVLDQHHGIAISSHEIEQSLGDFDRITLYRTIKSFIDKGLIHQTIDIDGQSKYAICNSSCDEHAHHDDHAHFECGTCKRTLCLPVPINTQTIDMPTGYRVDHIKVSLSGICEECQ